MTLQQLAKSVIDIQDAPNLSGVARHYEFILWKVKSALVESDLPHDRESVATHPVTLVCADKIIRMVGGPRREDIMDHYAECRRISGGTQP